jgi:hypothetical protein
MLTLMIAICKPFRLELCELVVLKDTMNQANLPLHLRVKLHFQRVCLQYSYTTIHMGLMQNYFFNTRNYNSLGGAIDIGAIFY